MSIQASRQSTVCYCRAVAMGRTRLRPTAVSSSRADPLSSQRTRRLVGRERKLVNQSSRRRSNCSVQWLRQRSPTEGAAALKTRGKAADRASPVAPRRPALFVDSYKNRIRLVRVTSDKLFHIAAAPPSMGFCSQL